MADGFIDVCGLDEVPPGKTKAVTVDGRAVLLCHDEALHAVANRCSHADERLECGRMRWGWIACPAHGARFDLETGEPLNPPATAPIRVYPVRVREGRIEVEVG